MTTILIVDDMPTNRTLLRRMMTKAGYEVLEASSGQEAIENFNNTAPDMILMDINMPGLDGYETTQRIKTASGDSYTPVIFVTALSAENALKQAVESGGDDFISKPVNIDVLQSKINAHLRIRELNKKLVAHNNYLSREHDLINYFFDNALNKSYLDVNYIKHHISPASVFNGDILLSAKGINGGLYLLIGDFTGHGLTAAMGTLPVTQAFFNLVNKGSTLKHLVSRLNANLVSMLPTEIFFSATCIELNPQGNRLSIWSGGMPCAILIDNDTQEMTQIQPAHMPLGILSNNEFDDSLQTISVNHGDRLYLYSDGIIEAMDENGVMYGEEKLLKILNTAPDSRFDAVLDSFHKHNAGDIQQDDITFVELTCNSIVVSEHDADNDIFQSDSKPPPLSISLNLAPADLRETNPVETILNILGAIKTQNVHRSTIHTILTELYNNALEHGLLKLDSSKKVDAEKFAEYYMDREERLSSLQEGYINITIDVSYQNIETLYCFTISDSGNGFTYKEHGFDVNFHGRGLKIINELCNSVDFSDNGRTVRVVYRDKQAIQ